MNDHWPQTFRNLWQCGVAAWQAGRRSPETMFTREDATALGRHGCTPQEVFDFVDDSQRYGEPDYATAFAIASIRRDYFLRVMGGTLTGRTATLANLPAKTDAVDGIAWLPRLIAKARLKLRGEMPADLMFGCGGDRSFLRQTRLTLPEFLQLVWDHGDDDRAIVAAVKRALVRG